LLDAGAGNDTMIGGTGDDIYVVDAAGDIVTELTNGGTDIVLAAISYSLADTDGAEANGGNVENLALLGVANIGGTGNALDNVIGGNSGANILSGGVGNDT